MGPSKLVPTDIIDGNTGEPLYVYYTIRSVWWWRWKRLWLFLRIVWRHVDEQYGYMAWGTAWDVVCIVYRQDIRIARTHNRRSTLK